MAQRQVFEMFPAEAMPMVAVVSAPRGVDPRALSAAAPPLKDNHLTKVNWRFK